MEYKQTPLALVARGITVWWWLGLMTCGGLIVWDVLKYKRTKLVLNDRSLTLYEGVMTQNSRDLPYRNIQTVNVHQTALGQMLGYGHIVITTAHTGDAVMFKYVAKPQVLREMIQSRIRD